MQFVSTSHSLLCTLHLHDAIYTLNTIALLRFISTNLFIPPLSQQTEQSGFLFIRSSGFGLLDQLDLFQLFSIRKINIKMALNCFLKKIKTKTISGVAESVNEGRREWGTFKGGCLNDILL